MNKNVFAHTYEVSAKERSQLKGHKGLVLWFTGLSGSGKSTIANALEKQLVAQKIHTYTLDGDNVRKGLNNNLAFSPEDRVENIRRIAEVSKLMLDAGLLVLSAFVSPYSKDREGVRSAVG
ncbi:MAG: adenylylsulfate kinase, partial [Patiriisocius sp.]